MDFASLMAAQIAKTSQKSSSDPSSKELEEKAHYVRRAERESAREAAYVAEQEAKEKTRIERLEKKRQRDDEEADMKREWEVKRQRLAEESRKRREEEEGRIERERRKRIGLPELPPRDAQKDGSRSETPINPDEDVPDEDLISKLRSLSEPARFFGETHNQRLSRYRKLTGEIARSSSPAALALAASAKYPIPTSLELVLEEDMKVPKKLPPLADTEGRLLICRQLVSWFTLVLKEWGAALARRDEHVKRTHTGQAATSSYTQAIAHLGPLFRKLEKCSKESSELPDELFAPLVEIVNAAQERRYVNANDGYLQLSIGKAAWPIGVTMVGIHERSAREKLHESDKKAHIMSDEATRKILQSIKRCLTFAQTRWPPEDSGQLFG